MKYSNNSNCKKLSMNWQKYVFPWEKWNFELIANSTHIAQLMALGKALNIYIDHLMFSPSRQYVKYFKYKVISEQ